METLNIRLDRVGPCHLCSSNSTNRKPDRSLEKLLKYLLVQTQMSSTPITFQPIDLHSFVQLCENCRKLISTFETDYKALRRAQIKFRNSLLSIHNRIINKDLNFKQAFDLPGNLTLSMNLGCLNTMHIPENIRGLITSKCLQSFLTYISLPELSTYLPAVKAFVSVQTQPEKTGPVKTTVVNIGSGEETNGVGTTNEHMPMIHDSDGESVSTTRPSVIMLPCRGGNTYSSMNITNSELSSVSTRLATREHQPEILRNLERQEEIFLSSDTDVDDAMEVCSNSTSSGTQDDVRLGHNNLVTSISPIAPLENLNSQETLLLPKPNTGVSCPKLLELLQKDQANPQSQRTNSKAVAQHGSATLTLSPQQSPLNQTVLSQERATVSVQQQPSAEEIAVQQLLKLSTMAGRKRSINPTRPANLSGSARTRPAHLTKTVRKRQTMPKARQQKNSAKAQQPNSTKTQQLPCPRLQKIQPTSTVTQSHSNPIVGKPNPITQLALARSYPTITPISTRQQPSSTVTQPQSNPVVGLLEPLPALALARSCPSLLAQQQSSSIATQPKLNPNVSQQMSIPIIALVCSHQAKSAQQQPSSTVTQPPSNPDIGQVDQIPALVLVQR